MKAQGGAACRQTRHRMHGAVAGIHFFDVIPGHGAAHSDTLAIHAGAYFGTFFSMNGAWSRWTRRTESARSSNTGMIAARTVSR